MREYLPIFIVLGIIGIFTLGFIAAYVREKHRKGGENQDRNIPDGEIMRRLMVYAKPYWKEFLVVFFLMILSNVYALVSPLLVGDIEEMVKNDFPLPRLYAMVGTYVGILLVSLGCTYIQSVILQKVGQKILSALRLNVFTHIESLSHEQLNNIPTGKLVTRVANDTNAISMMFTNILVTMLTNVMMVIGVLGAMLVLNYALTLMVLCFVPFLVLFTVIFRKFSRKVYRVVKDGTTDINTYLSENLSGIKITQIFNREGQKMQDFLDKSNKLKKAKQNQIFRSEERL